MTLSAEQNVQVNHKTPCSVILKSAYAQHTRKHYCKQTECCFDITLAELHGIHQRLVPLAFHTYAPQGWLAVASGLSISLKFVTPRYPAHWLTT